MLLSPLYHRLGLLGVKTDYLSICLMLLSPLYHRLGLLGVKTDYLSICLTLPRLLTGR